MENEKEIYFDESKVGVGDVQPSQSIQIEGKDGKKLTLDFGGDKLKTFGDLEYDEASKVFFDSLNFYFQKNLNKDCPHKPNCIYCKGNECKHEYDEHYNCCLKCGFTMVDF